MSIQAYQNAARKTETPRQTEYRAFAAATRGLMEHLRSFGEITSGPPPFATKDRSAFLSALDAAINRAKRAQA